MPLNPSYMDISQLLDEFRSLAFQLGRLKHTDSDESKKLRQRSDELESEIMKRAAW